MLHVNVKRHSDGKTVGRVVVSAFWWSQYESGDDQRFQWPEGVCEAADVLTDDEIDGFGITDNTVVYLEG